MYKLSASGYRNFTSVQATTALERHYSIHQCCVCLNVPGDTTCNLSLLKKKHRFFSYIAFWIFLPVEGSMTHIIFVHIPLVYSSLKCRSFHFVHIAVFCTKEIFYNKEMFVYEGTHSFVLR